MTANVLWLGEGQKLIVQMFSLAQMPIKITKVEGYYFRPNLTNTLLSASAVFKIGSFKLFTNKLK